MTTTKRGRVCVTCKVDEWYIRTDGRLYCRPCAINRSKAYYIEHHYNDEEFRVKENTWKREQKRRKRALNKNLKEQDNGT
jgi:hypothetical protein